MSRKLNLKVGQEIVVKINEHSNASRRLDMSLDNIDKWCFEGVVAKTGRKYITAKFDGIERQFSIEDDYNEKWEYGGANYKLYLNKQEVIDERECENLINDIRSFIGRDFNINNKLSLDQLRRIKNIIEE